MTSPAPARRVLVLLAHPALHRSRNNRALLAQITDLPGITVHDLYAVYPDFHIEVAREQALLAEHDVIVWQHPLYWYSTPAILKEWQDLVLTHGWAYGHEGTALRGKTFLQALTTGGPDAAYAEDQGPRHSLETLLSPVRQMAWLCGLHWLPPFTLHGTHRIDDEARSAAAQHYRHTLMALRDGTVDEAASLRESRLIFPEVRP